MAAKQTDELHFPGAYMSQHFYLDIKDVLVASLLISFANSPIFNLFSLFYYEYFKVLDLDFNLEGKNLL